MLMIWKSGGIISAPFIYDTEHKWFLQMSMDMVCQYTWHGLMESTIPLKLSNLFVMD